MAALQPTFFIPHGGGPCFFMPDPRGHSTGMGAFLRSLPGRLAERPTAILVVSHIGRRRVPDHERLRPAAGLRLLRVPSRDLCNPLRCARCARACR